MKYKVMHGDCIELMRSVCGDDSIDAIVTDPPAGIAFMGKEWDKDKGGRRQWIAWMTGVARECLRVLKPGGHALVWALPRTSHWTGTAWEDAGYEVRDCAYHAFGTGFPKSLNVSKAIDKRRNDEPEVRKVCRWLRQQMSATGRTSNQIAERFGFHSRMVDHWAARDTDSQPTLPTLTQWDQLREMLDFDDHMDAEVLRLNLRKGEPGDAWADRPVTGEVEEWKDRTNYALTSRDGLRRDTPATDDAQEWDGWGTALKPAMECWWLFRKPLSEKTVAKNVLEHGTGAINIDGCRIGLMTSKEIARSGRSTNGAIYGDLDPVDWKADNPQPQGRWPANLILSHHPKCECVGTKKVKACGIGSKKGKTAADKDGQSGPAYGAESRSSGTEMICYADAAGMETIEEWRCHPDCPVRMLDEQSIAGGMHGAGKARDGSTAVVSASYDASSYQLPKNPKMRRMGDKGGASRYFYQAKPAKKERNFGMPEGTKNVHPTVKSVALMRYLIRLVTPPGGTVLDAFAGSGSTVLAAMLEDVNCLACEKEAESYETAKQRCDYAFEHLEELRDIVDKPKKTPKKAKKQKKVEKS